MRAVNARLMNLKLMYKAVGSSSRVWQEKIDWVLSDVKETDSKSIDSNLFGGLSLLKILI